MCGNQPSQKWMCSDHISDHSDQNGLKFFHIDVQDWWKVKAFAAAIAAQVGSTRYWSRVSQAFSSSHICENLCKVCFGSIFLNFFIYTYIHNIQLLSIVSLAILTFKMRDDTEGWPPAAWSVQSYTTETSQPYEEVCTCPHGCIAHTLLFCLEALSLPP